MNDEIINDTDVDELLEQSDMPLQQELEVGDSKIDNESEESNSESKKKAEENMQALILQQDDFKKLKAIVEALLFASDKPLSINQLTAIIDEHNEDPNTRVRDKVKFNKKYMNLALDELSLDYENSAVEIKLIGPGYRIQTKADYATWVQRLWQEKPSKYSKATLETLAIIAYRQPITRGEIEHIRGVAVSSHIIRNLHDRNWIKVVGHKELPGRPAIYATTPDFLADLNLEKLEDLPTLADIKEIKQDLFSKLEEDNKLEEDQKSKDQNDQVINHQVLEEGQVEIEQDSELIDDDNTVLENNKETEAQWNIEKTDQLDTCESMQVDLDNNEPEKNEVMNDIEIKEE